MGLFKRSQLWWMSFTYRGKHYRKSTQTQDKKLVQRVHDKVKGEIAEGKWFDTRAERERNFKEMMDRYMEEHSRLRKKSRRRDLVSLSHLIPFFQCQILAEITPGFISTYKSQRLHEGAMPATLNRELALLKHGFNLAVKEWGWCKENPVSRVRMEHENNERDRILSFNEEKILLSACPPWLKEIVVFGLNTGAREGEILDLTWKDVDLFRRVVVIRQGKTGMTKTIPLTSSLVNLLKKKAKVDHLHHNLVFPSRSGTRISDTNLGRGFRIALRKAKIEDLRFHDLRHTFASRLAQAGVDLYLIQKLLGHKDPRMVQRYSHHSVESLRTGIEVLEILKKRANGKRFFTILSQRSLVGERRFCRSGSVSDPETPRPQGPNNGSVVCPPFHGS